MHSRRSARSLFGAATLPSSRGSENRAPGEEMPVVLLVARIMFYSAMEYAASLIVGNCKNLITLPTK